LRTQTEHTGLNRGGFTLVEIIVAVAIVAIMAGTIAPMAFREMIKAREEATLKELNNLNKALVEFYEDTGRFPTESEGLAALINDPGTTGWQGPYLGGDGADQVQELTTDSFNETYVYDLEPTTNPAGAADLLVVSSGADHALTSGRLNNTWALGSDGDDLLSLVSAGPVNRDKLRLCESEIQAIGAAAGRYFEDHASFPTGVGDLNDVYLDSGIGGGNFIDPWNTAYVLAQTGGGASPVTFLARSFGPDRSNDDGGGDDLTLNVSSVPPGRKATQYKLEIAQTVLNQNGSLALSGSWATDRATLGLGAAFNTDGWGQPLEINTGSRTIFSVGPDGNASMVSDNLPLGMGPGNGSN